MKSFFCLLILCTCLFSAAAVSAQKDPRPNDSIAAALYFGDIDGDFSENQKLPPAWETGDEKTFRVLDITAGTLFPCTGRIFLITDHIVFWLDTAEAQPIPTHIIDRLQQFDRETLPMLRKTFGTENDPGVDSDPRFHVLFTDKIGINYNGYFSAENSASPEIRPGSNGMELLFLNTRLFSQGADAVIDTLAHEYQHMIHFNYDPNEYSFINEGLSGLAEYLTLGTVKDVFIRNYLSDTGKSLIWWPDSGVNVPYYGSSFLFCTYLYDRFGAEFIRELVSSPENGLNGIDTALRNMQIPFTAEDLFLQWAAALLGQLTQQPVRMWDYQTFPFPQNGIYRDIRNLPCGASEVHETARYGLRFYSSSCGMPFSIIVEGAAESPVTSLPIPGGESAWWGGAASNSMALLSREFDLTSASGPVLFEYDISFDIEDNYDYYYLLLTDHNGKVTRLSPSTATDANPVQLNLGRGTTGRSGGVLHERIDISQWAGKQITISFVYLTDTASVADGLLIDNIRINAIGFSDDAEAENIHWDAEGFSRIQASVPQNFTLMILHPQADGTSAAEFHTFKGGETFTAECPEENCAFAVSAAGRDIRSRASFTIQTTQQR